MTNRNISRILPAAAMAAMLGALSAPAAAEIDTRGVIRGIEPVANAGFERFDIFSIRVDELGTAKDGEYQAVLTFRNDGDKPAELNANTVELALLSAGNEPRKDDGNGYDANVTGTYANLSRLRSSLELSPGEQARIRFAWYGSKNFVPTKLRLRETQAREGIVTYAVGK